MTSRKVLRVTLALFVLAMMLMPLPAAAQKDPFEPLVEENAGAIDSGSTGSTGGDPAASVPDEPINDPSQLPRSGAAAVSELLGFALILILLGTATLHLERRLRLSP